MLTIKKILCALDFSQVSEKVAEYVKALAVPLNAEIVSIHVVPSGQTYADFGIPLHSTDKFCETMTTEGQKTLAEFAERHFSGIPHRGKVACGDFSEEILACAEEEKVDLIVMGTHGRKGVDRLLFGSVAERVLKGAPCPVLAVRPS